MTLGFWHFLHDGGRISVSERGGEERWLDGQWDAGWRSTPGHNYDSLNQSWLPTTGRMLFIISIDLHSQHETWLSMAFKILQRKKTKRIITKLSISSFQTLYTTTYVSINVALWMKSKEGRNFARTPAKHKCHFHRKPATTKTMKIFTAQRDTHFIQIIRQRQIFSVSAFASSFLHAMGDLNLPFHCSCQQHQKQYQRSD